MMLSMHRSDSLKLSTVTLLALGAALLAGCAGAPPPRAPAAAIERITLPIVRAPGEETSEPISLGQVVAELAMGMIGTPYRYGGADPRQGFDCSGLVFYAYNEAGHEVPRTSRDQFRAARKISLRDAGAGDIMFFQDEAKLSHVGIYVGDGLFVHAPAKDRVVTVASIDTPYYQEHLVAVGRLVPRD